MVLYDPFAIYDEEQIEEIAIADEEMIMVDIPATSKVFGIDEGLFIGIIIGCLLCDVLGDI